MSLAAYTVRAFAEAHSISTSTLYALWQEGRGPRHFHVGRRRLISAEAALDWRRQLEESASKDAGNPASS